MKLPDKNKAKTRRDFLLASTAVAGGFVSMLLLNPFQVKGESTSTQEDSTESDNKEHATIKKGQHHAPGKGKWYGFGFDIEKCIGCGSCAKACKQENDVPAEPFYFRTWVEQYAEKDDGTVKVESPNGGIDGLKQSVPDDEIFKSYFVPKTCNHCTNSPCEQVCPVGATFITPDGVVLADKDYCIGCGYCIQACPYGCRYLHPKTRSVDKCTLCYHRISQDIPPACVEVCPTGARMYGDLRDKQGELVAFIKNHDCHVLKPQLNTKPKLFYNALREEVK